jgi:hypothetical protein
MDLNFTPAEEAFRDSVQRLLAEKLPARCATRSPAAG